VNQQEEEAWERLELAIGHLLEVTGETGILADWILVTHVLSEMDERGSIVSTSVTGPRNQPQYRALGLLEYGAAAVRSTATEGD
jgi:hypothetical protein